MEQIKYPSCSQNAIGKTPIFLGNFTECFFCLQEPSHRMATVSFQSVWRYLKINTKKDIRIRAQNEEIGFVLPSDIPCCEHCSSLISNLATLIDQLEITKMLITNKIKGLHQVFSEGEKRMNIQPKMTENRSPAKVPRMEYLRAQTMKKCRAKMYYLISSTVPRVLLTKVKFPVVSSENMEDSDSADADMTDLPNETPTLVKTEDVIMDNMETEDSGDFDASCPTPDNSLPPNSSDQHSNSQDSDSGPPELQPEVTKPVRKAGAPKKYSITTSMQFDQNSNNQNSNSDSGPPELQPEVTKPVRKAGAPKKSSITTSMQFVTKICKSHSVRISKSHYECQVCQKLIHFSKMRLHIVCVHPEVFFAKARLPTVPLDKFKSQCMALWIMELNDAKNTRPSDPGERRTKFTCSYCHESNLEARDYRFHLMKMHCYSLQEKLKKLQDTPDETLEPQKKWKRIEENTSSAENKEPDSSEGMTGSGQGLVENTPHVKDFGVKCESILPDC